MGTGAAGARLYSPLPAVLRCALLSGSRHARSKARFGLPARLLDAEPGDIERRQDILMPLGARLVENQTFASSLGAYQFFAASGPSTATLRRDYSGPVRTD